MVVVPAKWVVRQGKGRKNISHLHRYLSVMNILECCNISLWFSMHIKGSGYIIMWNCLLWIFYNVVGNDCPNDPDNVIKWKHFPRYWPFVRGIHRSPVNSPHKGQWRGALMFSLICARINGWVNNGEAGDLRSYRSHYDVIVMMHWYGPTSWEPHPACRTVAMLVQPLRQEASDIRSNAELW